MMHDGYEEEVDEELPAHVVDDPMVGVVSQAPQQPPPASPPHAAPQGTPTTPPTAKGPASRKPPPQPRPETSSASLNEIKKEPSDATAPTSTSNTTTPTPAIKKEDKPPSPTPTPTVTPTPTPNPRPPMAGAKPAAHPALMPLPANSAMLAETPHPREKRYPDEEKQQKLDVAETKVQADPFDSDAWVTLVMEAQQQPIDRARDIYERFFAIYPTAGRYWKYYAEQEMAAKNYDRVEKIFLRCLRHCPNIDLWRTYITCETQPAAREEVRRAFEFALEHMGMDISSTQIWQDFLTFLKAEKATNPFEEGNKMTAIRKLFQRATENPMHNLEAIWKDYDQFENGLSKILAKALLTEQSPKYMGARVVYRERKLKMEGILRNMLARSPRGTVKEEHQVRLWRRLLNFEKSNPQKLDATALRGRVTFAYNQALLCLYHYPDVWLEFAMYQSESGAPEAAVQVFERAILALPNNLFMHFAYADYLESNKKVNESREVYEKFMKNEVPDPLVVIQYMRFARRTEGIEGPRRIFKRVRPVCAYYVFVALAHIEFFVNKNPRNARDVFEDGLKKFPQESVFALQYLEFMKQLNEDNNTRALYERILLTLPKEKAQEVWANFAAFECATSGDLTGIMKLEKRRSSVYPEIDPSGVFASVDRYKYLNLWPCTEGEMESFGWDAYSGPGSDEDELPLVTPPPLPGQNKKFPRPDVAAMVLYRPEMSVFQPTGGRNPVDIPVPPVNTAPNMMPINTQPPIVPAVHIPHTQPTPGPIPLSHPPQPNIHQPPPHQLPPHQAPNIHPQLNQPPNIIPQQQQLQQQQQQPLSHPPSQPPNIHQPQQPPVQPPFVPPSAAINNQPPSHGPIIPDFLQKFISLLPPPNQYHGPYPSAEAVLSLIRDNPLPPLPTHTDPRPGSPGKAKSNNSKRKTDDDSDEETEDKPANTVNQPPTHDIYRRRQAQRMSKQPRL